MPYPDTGTGSGGSLPFPYTQIVTNGKLQLLKAGVLVAEQDEFGSWFASTVMTGTNSYDLGEIISMCAAGENVAFVNRVSNNAYSSVWCATSLDGNTVYPPTARIPSTTLLNVESVGTPHATITGPYAGKITASGNVVFYRAEVKPAENYNGRLKWICHLEGSPDKEMADFVTDVVTLTAGTIFPLQFKVPLWVKTGQVLKTKLLKADGTLLQAYYGSTDTTQPWRKTFYRTWVDKEVLTAGGSLPPASIPDLYNPNKVFRLFWDCLGSGAGAPAPMGNTTTNATLTQVVDGNRIGVIEATSSTTANGFAWYGAGTLGTPLSAAPMLTFYFKTPAVIDAATSIKIGLTVNVAGNNDVTGIDILGTTAKLTNIINGVANQTSGSIPIAANTWYTARINFTSVTSATCTLYSAAGASLLTGTITAPFAITATTPATFNGLKASNSGIVAVPMVRLDAYELVVKTSVSDRVYLDV